MAFMYGPKALYPNTKQCDKGWSWIKIMVNWFSKKQHFIPFSHTTFSLAGLFYFTVHRCTKLVGPKVK